MNRPPKGDELRKMNAHTSMGRVYSNEIPDMHVQIAPISYWHDGVNFIEYAGGITPEINTAIGGAKWALISIAVNDGVAIASIKEGEVSANSPVLPRPDANELPLAAVYIANGVTQITNEMIYDVRGIFNTGVYPTSHASLTNNDYANSHPIAAITNLQTELNNRPTFSQTTTLMETKADKEGTDSLSWTLNNGFSGVPTSDVSIVINRGTAPNVGLKWNEQVDKLQFTNDGIQWFDLSNAGFNGSADVQTQGMVRLSVDPVLASDPVAVGDNDTRILTVEEKHVLLDHLTSFNDPHHMLSYLNASNLPAHTHTGIGDAGSLGTNVVDTAQLKDGSVINGKISNGTITAEKLAINTITRDQIAYQTLTGDRLAPLTITANQLMDNSVNSNKIIAGAVNTNHIADGAVTVDKIAINSIDNARLTAGCVKTVQIEDNAVILSKLSPEVQAILNNAGSITGLADGSIVTAKLADNVITTEKINNNAVTLEKLSDGLQQSLSSFISVVTTNNIQDGSVLSSKIANKTITDANIMDGVVTEQLLSSDVVASINTKPIDASRLIDATVGIEKINTELATIINSKENASEKGMANGYAPLNETAKIPLQYMPQDFGDMFKNVYDKNNNGIVDLAEVAQNVDWLNVNGKPVAFVPETHTHSATDIVSNENNRLVTDAQISTWNSKANSSHTHVATDITTDTEHLFVSSSQINSWNAKQDALGFVPENPSNKNVANGYVGLDTNGIINTAQIPVISPSNVAVDSNNRFVTDVQISAWNAKQNAIGFTPENSENKNVTNGYAGLDSNGLLSTAQIPSIDAAKIIVDPTHLFVNDAEKAIWNAKQNALGFTPEDVANKNISNGYAGLDSNGKISIAQVPDSLKEIKVVANIAARDALAKYEGLTVFVIDATLDTSVQYGWAQYIWNSVSWIKVGDYDSLDIVLDWNNIVNKPTAFVPAAHVQEASTISVDTEHRFVTDAQIAAWDAKQQALTVTPVDMNDSRLSDARTPLAHTHVAADVVVDANRAFISESERSTWNAKQNALGFTPENSANKNIINGYAGLDNAGKVSASQIPSLEASIINQTEEYRFVTDVEKNTWNAKASATHSHNADNIITSADYRFVTDAQIAAWNANVSISNIPAVNIVQDDDHKFVTLAQITAWSNDVTKVDKIGNSDIAITDAAKGLILTSPDGSQFRITVANDGALSTTKIV